jgi:thioredoxin 1
MTLGNFEKTIDDNDIVMIDFWAGWCAPCRAFEPIYEAASEKHEDVVFAKVDTEAEQNLAGMFGIRSIPTLAVFRQGILLFKQPGMLPGEVLEDLIGQVKKLDMDEVRAKIAEEEAAQAEEAGQSEADA